MATTRSSLLEGLEEISEEEQLRKLLEISKQDVGPDTSQDTVPGTNSFEEWASLPADMRLQMVRNADTSHAPARDNLGEDEDEDEEYRKAIEVSKKEKFLTEEEKTNLAIEQSLSPAQPVNYPLDMGQLESAIRTSLSQSYQDPAVPSSSLGTVSPASRSRPVSGNKEEEALTFQEQMEEAMRQSVQGSTQLSFDEQIQIALERSQRSAPAELGAIPKRSPARPSFREVVIDGSNVCWLKKDHFIMERLQIVSNWFLSRGYSKDKITIILPLSRWKKSNQDERKILDKLQEEEILTYTPHRRTDGRSWNCYDDRFIVSYAAKVKGIVVTNDNYRDIINESEEFREQIENRVLPYSWIKDTFMPAEDPLGKDGPRLEEFLKF